MNFKEEYAQSDKKWDVFEKLFTDLGIKHHGAFYDHDINAVFVRVDSLAFDSDMVLKAMGIPISFETIGMLGALTDDGPFKKGKGWFYINLNLVNRYL